MRRLPALACLALLFFPCRLTGADTPWPLGETRTFLLENAEGPVGSCLATLAEAEEGYTLVEEVHVKLPTYRQENKSTLFLDKNFRPTRLVGELSLELPGRPQQSGKYSLQVDFADDTAAMKLQKGGKVVQDRTLDLPAGAHPLENFKIGQLALMAWRAKPAPPSASVDIFVVNDMRVESMTLVPLGQQEAELRRGEQPLPVSGWRLAGDPRLTMDLYLAEGNRLVGALLQGGLAIREKTIEPFLRDTLPPDHRAIHEIFDTLEVAWRKKQLEPLMALYDDEGFVSVGPGPGGNAVVAGKSEVLGRVQTAWKKRTYLRHDFTQRQIDVQGSVAIVRTMLVNQVEDGPEQRVRVMIFLGRREKRWRIVSFASSLPLRSPQEQESPAPANPRG